MVQTDITFSQSKVENLPQQIAEYFTSAGFRCIHQNEPLLTFARSGSFFNTWTFNPLKWKADVTVTLQAHQIHACFFLDTAGQLYTYEEEQVWRTFIKNFPLFLAHQSPSGKEVAAAVRQAKKSGWKYVGWAATGALIGGLTGMLLSQYIGTGILSYGLIPAGAHFLLKNRISHKRLSAMP